jgi:hypothetical protein
MDDNLSSLFQVAPQMAGYMLGGNVASARQTEEVNRSNTLADIMAKQQTYDLNTQMNPLKVEQRRLENTGLGLKNENDTYDNTIKRDTMGSTIGATNAKNQFETQAAHIKQSEELERKLGEYARVATQVPAPMRGAAVSQMLAGSGIDINNPKIQAWAQQLANDPNALAQTIETMRRQRVEMSAEFIKEIEKQKLVNQGHETTTRMNNNTQLELEKKRIEAGKYDKKKIAEDFEGQINQQLLKASGSARAQHAILVRAATVAQQGGLTDLAMKYGGQADAIRPQVEAEIASPKPGGVNAAAMAGVPAQPSPNVAPPGWNPQMQPKPQGNMQVPAGAVEKLKANPALAAAFDQKYGPGSAARVLGK